MKYLKKFDTSAEFEAAYDGTGYTEPWTSLSPARTITVSYDGETYSCTDIGVFYYPGNEDNGYGYEGYWRVWQEDDEKIYSFPVAEDGDLPPIGQQLTLDCDVENGILVRIGDIGQSGYELESVGEIPGKVTYNKKGLHHKIYLAGDWSPEIAWVEWHIDTGETTITCEDLEDIAMAYACYMQNNHEGGNMYYYFLRYRRTSPGYGKEWWPYSPSNGFLDNLFFAYCDDDEVKIVSNPE